MTNTNNSTIMRAFWLAVLAVGTLVLLTVVLNGVANASTWHTRTKKVTQESAGTHLDWYWLQLRADWTTLSAGECGRLYPCFDGPVAWHREYGEGLYHLDHWFDTILKSGVRADGIKWRSATVGGEFKGCLGVGGLQICGHDDMHIKMVVRSNGTSTADAWFH
jgi:hypothetical protein